MTIDDVHTLDTCFRTRYMAKHLCEELKPILEKEFNIPFLEVIGDPGFACIVSNDFPMPDSIWVFVDDYLKERARHKSPYEA